MRERGLKLSPIRYISIAHQVAPHAGAWIETSHLRVIQRRCLVAPHAGAWIETSILIVSAASS